MRHFLNMFSLIYLTNYGCYLFVFAYVVLLTLCSCLIAGTLFPGLKTCLQVARYMFGGGESMIHRSTTNSIMDRNEKINAEWTVRVTSICFLIFCVFFYLIIFLEIRGLFDDDGKFILPPMLCKIIIVPFIA